MLFLQWLCGIIFTGYICVLCERDWNSYWWSWVVPASSFLLFTVYVGSRFITAVICYVIFPITLLTYVGTEVASVCSLQVLLLRSGEVCWLIDLFFSLFQVSCWHFCTNLSRLKQGPYFPFHKIRYGSDMFCITLQCHLTIISHTKFVVQSISWQVDSRPGSSELPLRSWHGTVFWATLKHFTPSHKVSLI
jgi:hypothetical protein